MILVGNMVEKMIKICQIFFSEKKNLKALRKLSFIKNVHIELILVYIYDMALGLLPLKVGTTIVKMLTSHQEPNKVQFFKTFILKWKFGPRRVE